MPARGVVKTSEAASLPTRLEMQSTAHRDVWESTWVLWLRWGMTTVSERRCRVLVLVQVLLAVVKRAQMDEFG